MIQTITQLLTEKLELKQWSSKVLLRPLGYDLLCNKFTVVIKSSNRAKKYFVKVSSSTNLNDLLQEEVNNTLSLASFGLSGIPKIIFHGALDGRYFLVQEFIEGERPHSSRGTFETAYSLTQNWLLSLCSETAGKKIEGEDVLRQAEEFVSISSEFFGLSDSLSLMDNLRPSSQVPASWAHGDFWHGNLIIDSMKKLWVTDFSFSSPNLPPIDILDLIADYEPSIFLSSERLRRYTSPFIPSGVNTLFLILYSLNRKIALKVRARKRLYEELLILNLDQELGRIEEVGILKYITEATRASPRL